MSLFVRTVRTRTSGDPSSQITEFITVDVKPVIMNGLSNSTTHSSSNYLESAPQWSSSQARTERQDAGGSPDLQRKLGARDSDESRILVIYQLLLKNNTKYWGIFWRNVRAGVFS